MAKSRQKPKKLSVGFLYDDTLDSNDGVSQYVKTLGAWLSNRGHKVSYLVGETTIDGYSGGKVYSLAKNVAVVFNGNRLSIPLPASRKKIRRALKDARPDVLHVQVPYSPFMSQKVINTNKHAAIVGTFHIFPASRLVGFSAHFLRLAYGRSLKRFDSIRSVSPPAQDFARGAFKIDSQILPNMVDVKAYKAVNAKVDPKKIVFVGRLVERKGCRYLIQAFANLAKSQPDIKLVIAGHGEQLAELKQMCKDLNIKDRVEFLGFVSEQEKMKLLASAAVACYPSLYGESFGIVLIEAMAAHAAVVVAGDNPGYHSVLEGKPETLVDPKNIDDFALKLGNALNDKVLRQQLLSRQAELVKKYDVEVVGPQVEEWYAGAIANKLKTRHN